MTTRVNRLMDFLLAQMKVIAGMLRKCKINSNVECDFIGAGPNGQWSNSMKNQESHTHTHTRWNPGGFALQFQNILKESF